MSKTFAWFAALCVAGMLVLPGPASARDAGSDALFDGSRDTAATAWAAKRSSYAPSSSYRYYQAKQSASRAAYRSSYYKAQTRSYNARQTRVKYEAKRYRQKQAAASAAADARRAEARRAYYRRY